MKRESQQQLQTRFGPADALFLYGLSAARCLNPCLWLFWERWHGGGIGSGLLVHALNEQAKAFCLGHGFIESPIEPMTLMLSLAQTAA